MDTIHPAVQPFGLSLSKPFPFLEEKK